MSSDEKICRCIVFPRQMQLRIIDAVYNMTNGDIEDATRDINMAWEHFKYLEKCVGRDLSEDYFSTILGEAKRYMREGKYGMAKNYLIRFINEVFDELCKS